MRLFGAKIRVLVKQGKLESARNIGLSPRGSNTFIFSGHTLRGRYKQGSLSKLLLVHLSVENIDLC